MSVESPPSVICDTYNYKNWNVDTGTAVTKTWVLYNFLSKRVSDSAQGVISFLSEIKTNAITAYSGNTISIGSTIAGQTVTLYAPQTIVPVLSSTDNSFKMPNTAWVQSWFGNIINNMSLIWALAQTFTLGIVTNSIKCITTSSTLNINSVDSATGGVIICGGPSQTSGITIGNNNGITTNKIDIGSLTKNLTLNGSNIDLASALRPVYSYTSSGTGTDRIGQIISATYSAGTGNFSSGSSIVYSTLSLTKEGIYNIQIQGSIYAFNTTNISSIKVLVQASFSNTYGSKSNIYSAFNLGTFSASTVVDFSNVSTVYNSGNSGLNNYTMVVTVNYTGTAPQSASENFLFIATRIA